MQVVVAGTAKIVLFDYTDFAKIIQCIVINQTNNPFAIFNFLLSASNTAKKME